MTMGIERLKSTIGRRTGLAPANRYAVFIPMPLLSLSSGNILGNVLSGNRALGQVVNDPRDLTFLCESVSLPGRTMATTDYITTPKSVKMPYSYMNDDVTMTFLLTGDMYAKNIFSSWQDKIMNTNNKQLAFKDEYVSTITIQQLNQKNIPVYTCTLKNAFPVSTSSIELSNNNDNTVSRVSVTFAYDDWSANNFVGTAVGGLLNAINIL